ncbi:MAG: flavodoxin domain-containing protein [Desulfobacteraceae bacterium]|nr:MAG: flavodoxin domain-containing protein [Desulfobacteraceae bacterium]
MKNITRREFVVESALLTGGAIGLIALGNGVLSPQPVRAAKVSFPASSCGVEKEKGCRVLIAYASCCGSTGEVAEAIGQVMCDSGTAVDVRLAENVRDLSSYQAAIIGSAIHSSKWLPEAMRFVEDNQKVLSQMPVAYFLTCLTLYKSNDTTRRIAGSYLDPVLDAVPQVKPVDMGFFAGVLDYGKLSIMVRMIMKSKIKKKGVPEGDHRNWDAIRSWAEGVSSKILSV